MRRFELYLRAYETELKRVIDSLEDPDPSPWFIRYCMEQARFLRERLEKAARSKERKEKIKKLDERYLPNILEGVKRLGDSKTYDFFLLTFGRFLKLNT